MILRVLAAAVIYVACFGVGMAIGRLISVLT
jgi:hypothetical protein